MSDYQISAIGHIQSPYKQKFAIPRQPRLVPEAKAKLIFAPDFNREEFVRGLDEFSHIWLLFRFHETADKGYSAMVRPPRLGGNERKGVFATRATFRPNAIGMSAVKLEGIEYKNGQLALLLAGIVYLMVHLLLILSLICPIQTLYLMQALDLPIRVQKLK